MITAVDTNVLLDVFAADPTHGEASREALAECLHEGPVFACEVVWAEVHAAFPHTETAEAAMLHAGVTFTPMAPTAASSAGAAWRRYRQAGGPRERLVADFLIGAHAADATDRLLTRDRGFYRRYFTDLEVVDPSRP
jgi:predicted nucleic acid-binding protein